VVAEPQPSSLAGSSTHGVEGRAMKRSAATQLRSGTRRGTPPAGRGGGGCSSGWMRTCGHRCWPESYVPARVEALIAGRRRVLVRCSARPTGPGWAVRPGQERGHGSSWPSATAWRGAVSHPARGL